MSIRYPIILIILFFNSAFGQTYVPYRSKDLWGLADFSGNIQLKPFANYIDFLNIDTKNGSLYLAKNNKGYFVINTAGKKIVPENNYDTIQYLNDHTYFVSQNKKFGLFYNGNLVIPCQYKSIKIKENNSFQVSDGYLCGLFNSKFQLLIPISYEYIFLESYSPVTNKITWKAIGLHVEDYFDEDRVEMEEIKQNPDDIFGKVARSYIEDEKLTSHYLNYKYDQVLNDYTNMDQGVYVIKNKKYGYYNLKKNRLELEPEYDLINSIHYKGLDYLFIVSKNKKYGIFNKNFEIIFPLQYDHIQFIDLEEGLVTTLNKKIGFIFPANEKKEITPKYDYFVKSHRFRNSNIFLIEIDGKRGWVNQEGFEYFNN